MHYALEQNIVAAETFAADCLSPWQGSDLCHEDCLD